MSRCVAPSRFLALFGRATRYRVPRAYASTVTYRPTPSMPFDSRASADIDISEYAGYNRGMTPRPSDLPNYRPSLRAVLLLITLTAIVFAYACYLLEPPLL